MNLVLTNMGAEPLPVFPPDGSWVDALESGLPLGVHDEEQVLIVGDKPDVRTQLEQAARVLSEVARRVKEAIENRAKPDTGLPPPLPIVRVQVENLGANDIRVILGDGVSDFTVTAGDPEMCVAAGYLELRELGQLSDSQKDGGTQPSSAA